MRLTEYPNQLFHEVTKMVPLHLWHPGEREAMDTHCDRWKPSIHLPRSASRLALEVVGVRVERLQEISEADAKAEGVASIDEYAALWDSINGVGSWALNPWVWVVEFKKMEELTR